MFHIWNNKRLKVTFVKGSATPLYDSPYIAVYGRNTCGYTARMLKDLDKFGINYKYFIVDDPETADILHARMDSAGVNTRRYNLPVVDVYGSISVRPESKDVMALYNAML